MTSVSQSPVLFREGPDLDALLAELDAEYPGGVRVVDVSYGRDGGVMGFFAKRNVGVHYTVDGLDGSDSAPAFSLADLTALSESAFDAGYPTLPSMPSVPSLPAAPSAAPSAAWAAALGDATGGLGASGRSAAVGPANSAITDLLRAAEAAEAAAERAAASANASTLLDPARAGFATRDELATDSSTAAQAAVRAAFAAPALPEPAQTFELSAFDTTPFAAPLAADQTAPYVGRRRIPTRAASDAAAAFGVSTPSTPAGPVAPAAAPILGDAHEPAANNAEFMKMVLSLAAEKAATRTSGAHRADGTATPSFTADDTAAVVTGTPAVDTAAAPVIPAPVTAAPVISAPVAPTFLAAEFTPLVPAAAPSAAVHTVVPTTVPTATAAPVVVPPTASPIEETPVASPTIPFDTAAAAAAMGAFLESVEEQPRREARLADIGAAAASLNAMIETVVVETITIPAHLADEYLANGGTHSTANAPVVITVDPVLDAAPVLEIAAPVIDTAPIARTDGHAAHGIAEIDELVERVERAQRRTAGAGAHRAADEDDLMAGRSTADYDAIRAKFTLRRQLLELGVPIDAVPDDCTDPYRAIDMLVASVPQPPALEVAPGEILVVVGPATEALRSAQDICLQLRIDPSTVWAAGCPSGSVEFDNVVFDRWQAARIATQLRRSSAPTVIVVATDHPGDALTEDHWVAGIVSAVAPEQMWLVVDATRKPSDTRAVIAEIGEPNALIVADAARTASPASVWELDIPVAMIDGRPATRGAWAVLLIDKLTALDI